MTNLIIMTGVFAFTFVCGYLMISRVPSLLHTPLMSMTNAVSAITISGALILFSRPTSLPEKIFGGLAIVAAAFNIVGGFVITDRMLRMFRMKSKTNRT